MKFAVKWKLPRFTWLLSHIHLCSSLKIAGSGLSISLWRFSLSPSFSTVSLNNPIARLSVHLPLLCYSPTTHVWFLLVIKLLTLFQVEFWANYNKYHLKLNIDVSVHSTEMHRFRWVSFLPGHVGANGPKLKQHFSDHTGACCGHPGRRVQGTWQRRNPGRGGNEAAAAARERPGAEAAPGGGRGRGRGRRAEAPGGEREGNFYPNIPVQKVCPHGRRARVLFQLIWLGCLWSGEWIQLTGPPAPCYPSSTQGHTSRGEPFSLSVILSPNFPPQSSHMAPCHVTTSSRVLAVAPMAWMNCISAFLSARLPTTLPLTWSLTVTLASFSFHENVQLTLPRDFCIF